MTRDELIAEAFERWPDAYVFTSAQNDNVHARLGGVVHFRDPLDPDWSGPHPADRWELDTFWVDREVYTEIPRPASLPDPAGDLPDGTPIRAVAEGVTQGWLGGRGRIVSEDGTVRAHTSVDHVTVEVLEVPTPPTPSPLAATPGSHWRDPETGTEWLKGLTGFFAQTHGPARFNGILWPTTDPAVIARLVPVPTHETVSTVEELDALPVGSLVQLGNAFRKKWPSGMWYAIGSVTRHHSSALASLGTWTVVWRGEG